MEDDKEFKAETLWFHVMQEMVFNEEIGKMEGSTVKVYIVIKAYCNLKTGLAFPSIDLIAKKAYLSKMQVGRCLNQLIEMGYLTKEKKGKHNVYTLREKIIIKDANNLSQAVATWDYIPGGVKEAMAELKHAVMTGDLIGGKIIHIENLNLHLNVAKDHSTMVVMNNEIESLPSDMKDKLASLKSSLEKKKNPH